MQKHVNLIKSCRSRQELSNEYLLAKISVDTAENKPLKVHLIFKLRDSTFTEPPRPDLLHHRRHQLAVVATQDDASAEAHDVFEGSHEPRCFITFILTSG